MHRLRRVLRIMRCCRLEKRLSRPCGLESRVTLINDVRDDARNERLRAVAGDAGCASCHTHISCTERCPKQIAPTASIAALKRATAAAALRGEL